MEKLFGGIYKGKTVLITGHTGFKGSWLALWLTKLGAKVIGYSLDIPTHPNHFKLLNLKIVSIQGDILDKKKLLQTIQKYKPDIIFHMAAKAIVRKSYIEPTLTFETNIIGTLNVLDCARQYGKVKAIVNITSDKCYKNKEQLKGYKEDDAMGGRDPYSASKGCAELLSYSYQESFFNINTYKKEHSTLLANARAGNVIGGGDWAQDRLIPDIMRAANKNNTASIRNPNAIRPWQHVLEPLSGYLLLGEKLLRGKKEFADSWNFGPSEKSSWSVLKVSQFIEKYWDKIHCKIKKSAGSLHEAHFLKLNSDKAYKQLRWKNVWGYKTTLEKTVFWYKNFYQNKEVHSEEDLVRYVNDARKLSLAWAK